MNHFEYKEQSLHCEDVSLSDLAEEYGTPLYVYSKNRLLENYRAIREAFGDMHVTVCYALKANSNPTILTTLAAEGAGADVVSAGEIHLALRAGFAPENIAFAGVGKREDEMVYALEHGVTTFNVESIPELQLLSLIAYRIRKTANVSLRINPDIDAQSHPYITTGLSTNKFGIESSKALEAFRLAATLPGIRVRGVHVHIGSQITRPEPFIAAAKYVAAFVPEVRAAGIPVDHIDFGGGFGVRYFNALRAEGLPLEDASQDRISEPAEILRDVVEILAPLECSLWVEPGRSIVADAGVLLTKVLYPKENGTKKFIIVDAAMTDLIRPALYQAHHQIVPCVLHTFEHETVDVVGPVCESGDFLARDRVVNRCQSGDLLAVMTAGAYGFVNTSHYNARPRPAEVLVNGERVRLVRPRESFEDLE